MERTEKQKMEDRMEKRAREIAKQRGMPEGLWELFLSEAYMEGFTKAREPTP